MGNYGMEFSKLFLVQFGGGNVGFSAEMLKWIKFLMMAFLEDNNTVLYQFMIMMKENYADVIQKGPFYK